MQAAGELGCITPECLYVKATGITTEARHAGCLSSGSTQDIHSRAQGLAC